MVTATLSPPDLDRLFGNDFLDNPYPTYAWLREYAPICFSERWNGFLVSRYEDVLAALRDDRLGSNRDASALAQLSAEARQQLQPLARNLSRWVVFTDPPDHTRLRGLINRAFLPRIVDSMRPQLESLVRTLARELCDRASAGEVELVEGLSVPLPVLTLCAIMGLPIADRRLLRRWSEALADFIGARQPTAECQAAALAATAELESYFRAALAERRARPPREDDLLSALLRAEEQGMLLGEQELLSTCAMILIGGHETTTNLISNAVWLLCRHPEQQRALRQATVDASSVIEETLRMESPLQRVGRLALDNLTLRDQPVRKGQRVFLLLGSANRDAARFVNPDDFLPARKENRYVSFGHGAHFCVGAALGKMEAQLALGALIEALPVLALGSTAPVRLDGRAFRGFKRLFLSTR